MGLYDVSGDLISCANANGVLLVLLRLWCDYGLLWIASNRCHITPDKKVPNALKERRDQSPSRCREGPGSGLLLRQRIGMGAVMSSLALPWQI